MEDVPSHRLSARFGRGVQPEGNSGSGRLTDTARPKVNQWVGSRSSRTLCANATRAHLDPASRVSFYRQIVTALTKVTRARTREGLGDSPLNGGGLNQFTICEEDVPIKRAGDDGTDIHISVGPKTPHVSEYDGIVAEMIPQLPRPAGWDTATLNRLSGKQVLIIGSLAYDNEHLVNDEPAHPKSGQPKRFSLWEIHPITEFFVCPAGDDCDPTQINQWQTLTASAAAHP